MRFIWSIRRMNLSRVALALLLCFSFSAASLRAEEKTEGASGSTEGTFAGIEQGDYAHFQIKTKTGADASFIILQVDKSVQSFLDSPVKLKGRKVRVFWKEKTIPEAGGMEKTVTKVEAREPLDH